MVLIMNKEILDYQRYLVEAPIAIAKPKFLRFPPKNESQLAILLGISKQLINKWKLGKTQISPEMLANYSRRLSSIYDFEVHIQPFIQANLENLNSYYIAYLNEQDKLEKLKTLEYFNDIYNYNFTPEKYFEKYQEEFNSANADYLSLYAFITHCFNSIDIFKPTNFVQYFNLNEELLKSFKLISIFNVYITYVMLNTIQLKDTESIGSYIFNQTSVNINDIKMPLEAFQSCIIKKNSKLCINTQLRLKLALNYQSKLLKLNNAKNFNTPYTTYNYFRKYNEPKNLVTLSEHLLPLSKSTNDCLSLPDYLLKNSLKEFSKLLNSVANPQTTI